MKKSILPLLLATAPVFAGEVAPVMAPAPQCDCPQGWTVGLEVLGLKPYQSEGYYDGDIDAGFRGSIGYEFGDCMFVKVSGFGYDSSFDETDSNYDVDLTVANVDLIVGQTFNQCGTLTLSPYVGLCWAKFEENWDSGDSYYFDYDFDGLGVVAGIDVTRSLGNNFSIYGKVKESIVFGDADAKNGYRGEGSDSENSDRVAFITEVGLGLQYDFTFSNIAANVRAGVEGQWWGGVSDDDSESIGLAGFVLGANFRF